MTAGQSPPPVEPSDEVHALIATLRETERRLEELTGGALNTDSHRYAALDLALQRQQTELKVLFNLMPALIWFKDTKNGILRVNQRVAEIAGKSVEEIEGKNSREIYPEHADRFYADDLEVIKSGVPKLGIVEKITNIDGRELWILTDKVPVLDKAGQVMGIVVMARDITEPKHAEEAIRESEARFSAAFEYAPIGVALVSPDGRWLKVNRALCDLFGYSEKEFLTRTISDLTHPEDIEAGLENMRRAVAGEVRSPQVEERYLHKRGSVIAALSSISLVRDAQGQPGYFVVQIQDITERKRAEDELRAINEKFHQLADNITDAFWIRSADMREVHYVSPAFERIWGRSVASLYANPHEWSDFILPEDRDRVLASFSSLMKDAPTLDIEYRILRPDGEMRWVRVRGFQIRDGDGHQIRNIGIVTDITERQLAAADLQESERALRQQAEQLEMERSRLVAAQQVAKVGSWETDLATMSVRWSAETHRIFESDSLTSTVTHKLFLALVHPEDRANVEEALAQSLDKHTPCSIEHRLLLPGGRIKFVEERWQVLFDAQNNPVRTLGTCQDVTTRRQSEDALRQSQKRLRDVFDGLGPSMFVGLLTPEGVLVEISRSPLEAAGLKPEDVLGKPFDETPWWTHSPEVQLQLREAIARAARGEASRYDVQTQGARGEVIDLDFSIQPLRDDSGEVVFLITSASVITERKAAEGALRQAQKMEAVGQLAAGVAHEFNNLMQALMSMSSILRFRAPTPEITEIGADMESLIKRGAGLTQQLLLFSSDRILEKADLDLDDQMQKASTLLRRLIPETITILVESSPEPLNVQGDAGQIQQVLLNLAINARDAMTTGGTLTLRTGREGDQVFLEVQDTGHGMDEETQRHLFEPFFTTKDQGKGTGLGLAVAHGIVTQHGGLIEVQSGPGEGSRFRILLPASLGVGVRDHGPVAEASIPSGGGRVLLVEDDASVRAGITTLLELINYEVIAAGSGEDALALVLNPPPDLLLSDITLPGMTGPTLVTHMRERWPALRVVLMSGYLEETMQARAHRDRWHFLQKPFEFADLARELQVAMDQDY